MEIENIHKAQNTHKEPFFIYKTKITAGSHQTIPNSFMHWVSTASLSVPLRNGQSANGWVPVHG